MPISIVLLYSFVGMNLDNYYLVGLATSIFDIICSVLSAQKSSQKRAKKVKKPGT